MWDLEYKESWALKNWCFWTVVLEKTLKGPLDCRISNQSILKEISPGCSLEGLMLNLSSNTLATWCKELTHLKRPCCWERLKAGGEGYNIGWDGCMASPTQWTWVRVNSCSWWWTGRPGALWFMGSQRVGHESVTELNWKLLTFTVYSYYIILLNLILFLFYVKDNLHRITEGTFLVILSIFILVLHLKLSTLDHLNSGYS